MTGTTGSPRVIGEPHADKPPSTDLHLDPYRDSVTRAILGKGTGIGVIVAFTLTIITALGGPLHAADTAAEVGFAVACSFLGIAFGYFFATDRD